MPLLVERSKNTTEKTGSGQAGVAFSWNMWNMISSRSRGMQMNRQTKEWNHSSGYQNELSREAVRGASGGEGDKRKIGG